MRAYDRRKLWKRWVRDQVQKGLINSASGIFEKVTGEGSSSMVQNMQGGYRLGTR